MMEWFERLFEVKQSKFTLKKVFFTFLLFLLMGSSLQLTMYYQSYRYDDFAAEFNAVREAYTVYEGEQGSQPIGEPINWQRERQLAKFFESTNFTRGAEFYYLDLNALGLKKNVKRTYVIDLERNRLYTREFVTYDMRRWHFPGAK
jgi:hypothetical protein